MGQIQTNIGLITGMPIGNTVDLLMVLAAKPRNMLLARTKTIENEQLAVTELSAMLLSVQYITDNLGKEGLYDQRDAVSSNSDVLSASVTGQPPMGSYQFTPLRTVQSQQLLSSGVQSDTESLGGGKLTFRFGRNVQHSASLELFDGGQGIDRGHILITDRSGARADINLSVAQTVNDVLDAINGNQTINVIAVANGDGFRLIDNTGQSVSNLKVQEVGRGSTAASLGLDGIDVAANVADGRDMIRLYDDIDLDMLNDGSGVRMDDVFTEIKFTLRDGTEGMIDLFKTTAGGPKTLGEITLGDVLDTINATAPDKLKAQIAPDGDRLVITDLTQGGGSFELSVPPVWSHVGALKDLGLDGRQAVDGVITGRRILGGAGTVLLSSLGGGKGFGELGALTLSDRSGASDTISLAGAETLDEVIGRINNAGVGIVAQVNRARNGIELVDTTGGYAANMIVASGDDKETAEKLGIAVDADVTEKNSGDMHLQVVAINTRLEDLNGGAGVARGSFLIQDSAGKRAKIDLRDDDIQTVGDLIDAIRRTSLSVFAEINDTGDGIRLVDYAGSVSTLAVYEGDTTTARDLNLFQVAGEAVVDGRIAQVINGSMTRTIELDDNAQQITTETRLADFNGGRGVAAGSFSIIDGNGRYERLDLAAENIQTFGELIDAINQLSLGVEAEINDSGNGIIIRDKQGGQRTLRVLEGTGTTAADLHLLGETQEADIDGETVQFIDGKSSSGARSLEDLRRAINRMGAGVTASTFVDGSSKPFRLSLTSSRAGRAGELLVDTSEVGFSMKETVRARDALLVFGSAEATATSILVSSSSNTFRGVLSGVTLKIEQASKDPVTVTVAKSDVDLIANVQTMVGNYNRFRDRLNELTAYDAESNTRSLLTADATALRLDTDLSRLISGRFAGAGSIRSLAEVGINLKDDGTLDFDKDKLKIRYATDPDAVKKFFTTEQFGVSDKFNRVLEQMTGQDTSLLANRYKTLRSKIDRNTQRIDFMNERLEVERNRLFINFYRMELAIAKMQASLSALDAINPLAPMV